MEISTFITSNGSLQLFTSPSGELAFQFALLNDLEQIVNQPTRIPDDLGDRPSISDLFFTTNPSNYSISVFFALGSSDHCLISSSSSITQVHSEDAPGQRCLWHFADANWESLKMYYFDFPWNEILFSEPRCLMLCGAHSGGYTFGDGSFHFIFLLFP